MEAGTGPAEFKITSTPGVLDTTTTNNAFFQFIVFLKKIIIWQAILRSNGGLSLANFWSGFYSTDHYHGNGPFVYFFFRSRIIQSRTEHKK